MKLSRLSFVGVAEAGTNALSAWLMNLVGNPYGTYVQEEGCVHCGAQLVAPANRTLVIRVIGKLAIFSRNLFNQTRPDHANWVHMLLSKPK